MWAWRYIRVAALGMALVLLTSGCFLRLALGGVRVETIREEVTEIVGAVFANASTSVCRDESDGLVTTVECTYIIRSERFPGIPEQTSTAELISEFGVFGLFVDPLILQVPSGAHGFVATFEEHPEPARALEMTVVEQFAAAPGRIVTAEPGQQLVILEFPADVADRLPSGDPRLGKEFSFALEFRLPELAPVQVKPMFTLAVEAGGVTYYPPMLPCVTDFSQVPGFELPVTDNNQLQDLIPQLAVALSQAVALACDGEIYDFTAAGEPEPPDDDEQEPPDDDEGDPGAPGAMAIDVKPGSDRNPVNPAAVGLIPVAVLTTSIADGDDADFDATTLDVSSVRFGRGLAAEAHGGGHVEDVDGDGDGDLVLHFATDAADIRCGDTQVMMTAMTFDGQPVAGADTIVTVGCTG